MKKSIVSFIIAAFMLLAMPFQAMAITVTPQSGSFGTLAGATFGGSGIPNNAVAITNFTQVGGGTLTLGLTAHQRYSNPPLTNNNAGTFGAYPGNDAANGQPNYATWNVGFYVSGIGSGQTTSLYYDANPAAGNDVANSISLGNLNYQDSWNMGMGFLGGAAFPESSNGIYAFALVTSDAQGLEVARSAILVNVGAAGATVSEGGSTALLLGGVIGLLAIGRRTMAPALEAASA